MTTTDQDAAISESALEALASQLDRAGGPLHVRARDAIRAALARDAEAAKRAALFKAQLDNMREVCAKTADDWVAAKADAARLRGIVQAFANPKNWVDEPGNLQWMGKMHAIQLAEQALTKDPPGGES